MTADLVTFLRACLDEDQQATEVAAVSYGPGWGARVLAEIAAKQAILDLHRQIECVNCEAQGRKPATSCLRCHHGDTDFGEKFYDGTCSTVRALAQPFAGRPGWSEEWAVTT